jgi:hypothetical protein
MQTSVASPADDPEIRQALLALHARLVTLAGPRARAEARRRLQPDIHAATETYLWRTHGYLFHNELKWARREADLWDEEDEERVRRSFINDHWRESLQKILPKFADKLKAIAEETADQIAREDLKVLLDEAAMAKSGKPRVRKPKSSKRPAKSATSATSLR